MKPETKSVDDIPDIAIMVDEETTSPRRRKLNLISFIKKTWEISSQTNHAK